MFVGVTLIAAILGGLLWVEATREKRELRRAFLDSPVLDADEKRLYTTLVWQREGADLLAQLGFEIFQFGSKKHFRHALIDLTWQGQFVDASGRKRRVFVLSGTAMCNKVAMIVVTDQHFHLLHWSGANCDGALQSATIECCDKSQKLVIVAQDVSLFDPHAAVGDYRYVLGEDGIERIPVGPKRPMSDLPAFAMPEKSILLPPPPRDLRAKLTSEAE